MMLARAPRLCNALLCLVLVQCSIFSLSVFAEDVEFHFHTKSSTDILHDVEIELLHTNSFILQASYEVDLQANLTFVLEEDSKNISTSKIVKVTVSNATVINNKTRWMVTAEGTDPGHSTLVLSQVSDTKDSNETSYNTSSAFIRFQIYHSQPLDVFSQVIGWIYFVAWSISFYPQVYLNWRRKSVVGLNFDFLGLNVAGFLCYSAYNIGLFWIPTVKDEYIEANPHDILPVQVNDVVFAIHALVLTCITVLQVFIYERGGQRMSRVATAVLVVCGLAVIIVIIIAAVPSVKGFNWFNMVYALSYVKLGITIIKYIPQVWMNFRRKSTVGWSIGNVLLDFTGGSGSILQMFILAYNFNDWKSIFLNPVKFWLGALSIFFDVIFIVQHYCLYRNASPATSYEVMPTNGHDE